MTLTYGPNLNLLVNGELGENHYLALMRQWRGFDALIQVSVLSRVDALPVSDQQDGDRYLVLQGPDAGKIARWSSVLEPAAWEYFTPGAGWALFSVADQKTYRYKGIPGSLAWVAEELGLVNPMLAAGDLIVGDVGGQPARLGKGAEGQVLSIREGIIAWVSGAGGGGMENPMRAVGDMIVGGENGDPLRLVRGDDGSVLTLVDGVPTWVVVGGSPVTAEGDIYVGGAGGVPSRLPIGPEGRVLGVAGGKLTWVTVGGGGGGLSFFSSALDETAPNDTVPLVTLAAVADESEPTKKASLCLHLPDSGALLLSNVNADPSSYGVRGDAAVDLQRLSTSPTQIASGAFSTLVGGMMNTASAQASAVVGGMMNEATGQTAGAFVGQRNKVGGSSSAIVAGQDNEVVGDFSTILGGSNNAATSGAVVAGGYNNAARASHSAIIGGHQHVVEGESGVAVGGTYNRVLGQDAVAVGGHQHELSALASSSFVGGGYQVTMTAQGSATVGGFEHNVSGNYSGVLGGSGAIVSGERSGTLGGQDLQATGSNCAVVAGNGNKARGYCTVSMGGQGNDVADGATFSASVAGMSNKVTGQFAVSAGGMFNEASADMSVILGGSYARTGNLVGCEAQANGSFSAVGDAQRRRVILRQQTSAATPEKVGGVDIPVPPMGSFLCKASVLAHSATDRASWDVEFLVYTGTVEGFIAFQGTPTAIQTFHSSGASAWSVAATVDETTSSFSFEVTGSTGVPMRWVIDLETLELVGIDSP